MSHGLLRLQAAVGAANPVEVLRHWAPLLLAVVGLLVLVAVLVLWAWFRPAQSRGRHVRGTRLVFGSGWLQRLVARDALALVLGGVPLPRAIEPQHLLVTGATGAGKSQAIHGVLATLQARGEDATVTDLGGEAFAAFGRSDDALLNPLDARSVAWSPFAEMESDADADRLAKSMIPDHDGVEREWFVYSQVLVGAVLQRLREKGDATNDALLHALTLAAPGELKTLVQGLPAQALFHDGAERMLASVRGIVGTHLAPYRYLPKDAGPASWSIRRHVREGQGWLWLPYREDQAAALKPLLAAWLGEAVSAVLALPPDSARRHWLLLDEVASLGRVQGLADALTKGRKYGLSAIVGLQSVSQLRAAYGPEGAQTLLSCLSSQLLLRANDPETAEYASRHLGDTEVERESHSHGKQGRTTTKQHHVERLVLASEVQALPDRVGYLRLAGEDRVRRVGIPVVNAEPRCEPFIARPAAMEAPTPQTPAPSTTPPRRPALDAEAILSRARATAPAEK